MTLPAGRHIIYVMSTMAEPAVVDDSTRLVEQAKSGSQDALAEFVRRHHLNVRFYLSRFVADPHTADDLAQEVFLVALRSLGEFEPGRSLQAWLLGIARHRALHYLRTEGRRQRHEAQAAQVAQAMPTILNGLLAYAAEQAEGTEEIERELAALRRCLRKVPPHGQQLLEAFYYENRSADQIGAGIGRSAGAVRMMLLRLRQALNTCIKRKLVEGDLDSTHDGLSAH